MNKKLITLILLVVWMLWFGMGNARDLSYGSSASDIQKKKAISIPADRVGEPFHPFSMSEDRLCLIQYDNDSPQWYFPYFDTGWGFAVYMDPESCEVQNPYPFKITFVHLYLFDFLGAEWPVEIQINFEHLKEYTVNCPDLGIPGTSFSLYHQTFTIPFDSSYASLGKPMTLSLDSLITPSFSRCLDTTFFLEVIFTGGTGMPYPSLMMTDTLDSAETCHDWFFFEGDYHEWYDAWELPIPGKPIIRASGYTHCLDCYPCWYWKPATTTAPSGMPDFDQNQFTDSLVLSLPTAVANCLWWLDAHPEDTSPSDLIQLLSTYFGTDPDGGTSVDSLLIGLDRYFRDFVLDFSEYTYIQPDFYEMADSLKESQNIILLLGFWQFYEGSWHRFGGHAVTLAGACSEALWIGVSDPAVDGAELGWQGRFFPLAHPPHSDDDTLHNNSLYVSHDIYVSDTLFVDHGDSLDTLWRIKDFYDADNSLFSKFEGKNFQPGQQPYQAPYVSGESVYTAVEYAVVISPRLPDTLWYWKPARLAQDPTAESGMPDFDQYQFSFPDSQGLCGPTAIANCLWWLGEVPEETEPPELIRLLSDYFHSNSDSGTCVDSIEAGLDSLFERYGINLYQNIFENPNFSEIGDSLKESWNIGLLLGFWQWVETEPEVGDWRRIGGHFVTMAGVCSDSFKIAFSDPARDNAESGRAGRVRPSWHPSHLEDPTYHNNPINVSHDIYTSGILSLTHDETDTDTLWWIADYYSEEDTSFFYQFEGQNFQPGQTQYSYEPSEPVYTVVEYAIMISPKVTNVEEEEEIVSPQDFQLFQNHPNPFNNETIIKYTLSKSSHVSLVIYNILGQKVRTLVSEYQKPGVKTVSWDGKDEKGEDLSSGIYLYKLKSGEITQTKRMLLLK
jgi:hypothetical protein